MRIDHAAPPAVEADDDADDRDDDEHGGHRQVGDEGTHLFDGDGDVAGEAHAHARGVALRATERCDVRLHATHQGLLPVARGEVSRLDEQQRRVHLAAREPVGR